MHNACIIKYLMFWDNIKNKWKLINSVMFHPLSFWPDHPPALRPVFFTLWLATVVTWPCWTWTRGRCTVRRTPALSSADWLTLTPASAEASPTCCTWRAAWPPSPTRLCCTHFILLHSVQTLLRGRTAQKKRTSCPCEDSAAARTIWEWCVSCLTSSNSATQDVDHRF